jgi:hypothetical protein
MRTLLASAVAIFLVANAADTATAQLAPEFGGVPSRVSTGIGFRGVGFRGVGFRGVGFRGGGISGSLGLSLGQSSSRSITSTSASVTTLDGVPGFISDTVTRPFVTGFIPIVGDYPQPLDHQAIFAQQQQQAWNRARRSQENIRNRSLEKYLRRAYRAAEEGNKRMARANFRRAIGIADEPFRSELKLQMKKMLKR